MLHFRHAVSLTKHPHQHPDQWLEEHHLVRAMLWSLLALGFIASLVLLGMTLVQLVENLFASFSHWLRTVGDVTNGVMALLPWLRR